MCHELKITASGCLGTMGAFTPAEGLSHAKTATVHKNELKLLDLVSVISETAFRRVLRFWVKRICVKIKTKGAFLWENPNPDSCIQKRILRFFT